MKALPILGPWIVTGVLACGLARAADTPAGTPIPVAHSAQVAIDATPTDDSLVLHIRRATDQTPIVSKDVTVSVNGRSATLTAQPDGSVLLADKELRGEGERELEIIVGHDGIREVLSGKVSLPKTSAATGLMDHKQMFWWILNIVIILIAALAFSRRSGTS